VEPQLFGLCLSYGRADVEELLDQWSRQTRQVPLMLVFDGTMPTPFVRRETLERMPLLHVAHCDASPPRTRESDCIGTERAESMVIARNVMFMRYGFDRDAYYFVLDDDDYYAPDHVERFAQAIRRTGSPWLSSAAIGVQFTPDTFECVAQNGPGQHASWCVQLRLYDHAGGYRGGVGHGDDTDLAHRMGWHQREPVLGVTHVRRQYGPTISGPEHAHNRQAMRAASQCPDGLNMRRSERDELCEAWCRGQR